MESRDGWRKDATIPRTTNHSIELLEAVMSSKTLENLVKQSDLSAKQPLELWKQPHPTERRPSAAALAKRASFDIGLCAAGR